MISKTNKRGLQHVEFIISFVFFVGFLIAALYFFSPITGDKIVDSTLFYTMDEIEKEVSLDLESFSVNIEKEVTEEQVRLNFPEQSGLKERVVDSSGNVLNSGYDNSNLYVNRAGNYFFVVMFSPEFNSGGLGTGEEVDYAVSSSEKREVLSESKLMELKERYDSDYEFLKDDFNLPSRASFGFSISFSDSEIVAERSIPEGLEVFGESKRYEILRENGDLEFADLTVRVW